jgi:alcohol dehydrogenase class IV
MIQPFSFAAPTPVAFGENRLDEIGADVDRLAGEGASVLVVSDPGVVAAGIVVRVTAALEAAGHPATVFGDVRSDPKSAQVDAAAKAARESGTGCVVGVGGGSAMDVAKLAATIAPCATAAETYALGANPLPKGGIPRICVPTTAGTGSEVTRTSVFTAADGRKVWAWGERNRAHLAILDPTLTVGLPARLTAATGIDAMVHAIEGATSRRAQPFSDGACLQAIRMLAGGALARAVASPHDLAARGTVLMAACLAGIGFDATGVGVAHALGHALGAMAGVHHGRAVGLSLRAAIPFNVEAAPARYAAVARALGAPCDGLDDERAAAQAGPAYERLLRRVGLEVSLAGDGLSERDAERLAALAMAEENLPMCKSNPRPITPEVARALARAVLTAA